MMQNISRAMIRGQFNHESMRFMYVANSSQVITDLNTAATATFSATAKAAAIAAAGPMMDLPGVLQICTLKAQEIKGILAYVLEGSQVSSNLTAPTGGVVTSAADSTTYNTLVGVYQILK